MNKELPIASRGIAGLPSLVSPSAGVDVSSAATFQFPSGAMDLFGPFVSDVNRMYQSLGPLTSLDMTHTDVDKVGSIVPAFKFYHRVWDLALSKDDWVTDSKGNKLYKVEDPATLISQSVLGMEGIDLNMRRTTEAIKNRREIRINEKKNKVTMGFKDAIRKGKVPSEELKAKARELGMEGEAIIAAVENAETDPMSRVVKSTPLQRRRRAFEMYPSLQPDFGR
jgi:hypothetical protein